MKDVLWEEHGVLLYSTLSQVKYLLPSGESGIVRSLDEPVYLVAVSGRVVKAFTRKGELISFAIDSTEFMLKVGVAARCDVALPGAAALPRSHPPVLLRGLLHRPDRPDPGPERVYGTLPPQAGAGKAQALVGGGGCPWISRRRTPIVNSWNK